MMMKSKHENNEPGTVPTKKYKGNKKYHKGCFGKCYTGMKRHSKLR